MLCEFEKSLFQPGRGNQNAPHDPPGTPFWKKVSSRRFTVLGGDKFTVAIIMGDRMKKLNRCLCSAAEKLPCESRARV